MSAMAQEREERFGKLPEEVTSMIIDAVNPNNLPALRGTSKQLKRLCHNRFVAENFTDWRQKVAVKTLTNLCELTANEELRLDIKKITFNCLPYFARGAGEEAQEVWHTSLLTRALRNLTNAGISISIGLHSNISFYEEERDETLTRASNMGWLDVLNAVWREPLPHDSLPREISWVGRTSALTIRCSHCAFYSLPSSPGPRSCCCLLHNLYEIDLLDEPIPEQHVRTLCLEDCSAHQDEVLDILIQSRQSLVSVELINLHLWSDGAWDAIPNEILQLELDGLKLTLSGISRDRDSTILPSNIVRIQDGGSEVLEGREAITSAMRRWILARPL
ncbi:hypothetical protein BDV97DRAFT_408889 [Delphinella strobiligena]|nr:hypothetical protein BDV97DRAFT_408889 [Delphinella strobiligena]